MTKPEGTPTTPAECADAAAERVRAINHATRPGINADAGGLGQVGDVYDTVAGLASLAGRLPQALTQLATFVEGQDRAGRLVAVDETGRHTDPADAAQAVAGRLNDAAHTARVLASILDDAQQTLAILGQS